MKAGEVIAMVDRLKPNRFTKEDKYKWLSDVDGMICRELIDTHEDSPLTEAFTGYEAETDAEKELIAPFPYDQIYRWYLESQTDLGNMEITKYNNTRNLFNAAYLTFTDWYNRTHMPKQQVSGFTFTAGRRVDDALST